MPILLKEQQRCVIYNFYCPSKKTVRLWMRKRGRKKMFLVGQSSEKTSNYRAATALWRSQHFGIRLCLALDE